MPAMRRIISAFSGLAHMRPPTAGGVRPRRPDPALPEPPQGGGAYTRAGTEPPLEEVLRDPIVQLVMRADRSQPAEARRGPALPPTGGPGGPGSARAR